MMLFGFTTFAAGLALPAADWTEIIVPVVVFAVWLINQIAAANKGKPQAPAAGRGVVPPNPKQAKGPLEEVEQFLREARKAMEAQQRGGPQAPPAAPPQQQRPALQKPKPPRQQKQGGKKVEKPVARKTLAEQTRLKPQAADRELDEVRLGGSVSQHVQQHLGGNRFDEREARLSNVTAGVERDIGAHVKSVFDHQIGSLAVQRDAVADASAAADIVSDAGNPAAQIIAMLRDPQSLRHAIVLQEILQTPTHRW